MSQVLALPTEFSTDTEGSQRAIIIGAGPAELTAAYELLTRTEIRPIVLEKSEYMGGLARTVNYKGTRLQLKRNSALSFPICFERSP